MTWTIEQVTDGRGRRYVIKDEAGEAQTLPSVTTILGALPKGGLEWWGFKLGVNAGIDLQGFAEQSGSSISGMTIDEAYDLAKKTEYSPYRALKAAGARGTDVHAVAEVLLRTGKLDDLPADTKADEGYVDALVKWHTEFSVDEWEMVAVEELLFSQEYGYAGQSDLIARKPDGTIVVGDFKTSKGIYLSHHLQAVAYEHAAREMGLIGDEPVERHVVRLGLDGEFEVQHHPSVTISDFVSVLAVHQMLKAKDKKGIVL